MSNYSTINNIVKEELKRNNVSYSYNINYGNNLFPEKQLNGKYYDEGYYDSLVISLGKSSGENWWCILFPPLCLVENESEGTENVKYELFTTKVLKKIFK